MSRRSSDPAWAACQNLSSSEIQPPRKAPNGLFSLCLLKHNLHVASLLMLIFGSGDRKTRGLAESKAGFEKVSATGETD